MRVSRRLLGVVIAVVAVGLLASATYFRIRDRETEEGGGGARPVAAGEAEGSRQPGVAIPVEGAEVVRGTMTLSVTASGQAAAARQTKLLALVEGRVAQLPVRENSAVRAGDLVLALDTDDYRLALEQARARLAQREAQYRELTLYDDRIEDPELRAERDRQARIRAGVDDARLEVERAELNLRRARVTAPFDGRVADLRVVPGQYVRPGDEIATIVDVEPIHVEVRVLEGDVGQLRPGGNARVRFAAYPDEVFSGTIATINPVVDEQTRTAKVVVRLPNRGGRILPGMYAQVSLDARSYPDRIMVPRSAILERDTDRRKMLFVFENGTAQWKYVTTGLENETHVEIVPNDETEMLTPGQIVLTRGHYTLTHGAPVRLVENATTAEGSRPR